MELYDVVLFCHIAVLLFAMALTGTIHSSEWLAVRTSTVQEMRVLARPQAWGILFAPVVAFLLLLGSWLVKLSDDRARDYSFSDGWVWTAAVVLAIAFVAGFAVEGPHAERLLKALAAAPDGPVTPELRELASNRFTWVVGHAVTFMVIGVVSNMVNKPGAAVAILVIVVGAVVGSLLALVGLRTGSPAQAASA
jgi:hypothetical protein